MTNREYASFGMELSQAQTDGRTLTGYASVFNYPIETLESWLFGTTTYIRPGAFGKTIQENRAEIQVLFNHGHDPQIGEKPLGVPSVMREDAHGLYVEVPLDETSYNDDLIVSLNSGALRAMSIGFVPKRDSYNDDKSVREIHEVRLFDFGPVAFPANKAATAALHSLTASLEAQQNSDRGGSIREDPTGPVPDGDDALVLARASQITLDRELQAEEERMERWVLPTN